MSSSAGLSSSSSPASFSDCNSSPALSKKSARSSLLRSSGGKLTRWPQVADRRCRYFRAPYGIFGSAQTDSPHDPQTDTRLDSSNAKTFQSDASAPLRQNKS